MRRISSLPVSEYCPRADSIGIDIETTNALRSTIFHKYCETGVWPDEIRYLPDVDADEIRRWKKPGLLVVRDGDKNVKLKYENAVKEIRVALDHDLNYIDIPREVPLNEIPNRFPNVLCVGHLDIAWDLPELDLVVISDIKSSIFAVKARTKSLQLHGYGLGFAKKCGRSRYLVDIWDACDGVHFTDDSIVEIDSFEAVEYAGRIKEASIPRDGGFVRGTHCSGCWQRGQCPAHLVDVPDSKFSKLFNGTATESDVRQALISAKALKDTYEQVKDACETWVQQHGPVRSEDGLKEWRPQLRNGKKSLDTNAVAKALGEKDLSSYMKEGTPFMVYDWRNVKNG